jgi:hypothetical protein
VSFREQFVAFHFLDILKRKKHDDRPNGTNGNASRKNDKENFEFVKSHLCKFDSQLNADFVA